MSSNLLLSRVASSCFWLSRYRERAEFTARVVDVQLLTQLETVSNGYADSGKFWNEWLPLLQINGDEILDKDSTPPEPLQVLHTLILDPLNSNSIIACIRQARENSRQAREQISSEMWEQINDIYHYINRVTLHDLNEDAHRILVNIKNGALLMQGLTDQTMMHGEAWQFIQVGRYFERANTTARLLEARANLSNNSREPIHWISVLRSASSLEAYHKTYTVPVRQDLVIEYLLLNPESPRSILFSMLSALNAIKTISGVTGRRYNTEPERILGQMAAQLQYLRMQDTDLMALLDAIQICIAHTSEAIYETYFAYELI